MQEYCSNLTVNGKIFSFYDLEKAAKSYDVKVEELPYSIRILLESLLRKKDGIDVKESHISDLIKFPNFPTISEIPLNQVASFYKISQGFLLSLTWPQCGML